MSEHFIWTEKYRPKTIEDCILPQSLKTMFQQYVEVGELPNFLFFGTAGCGKTTVAKALCDEIGADWIIINGSEESGIDVLRTKIRSFASTVSLTDAKKVVILDEADYLNANSTQPALRNFIEEFAENCRFIFTCNYKNRIIKELHSRCASVDFKLPSAESAGIASQFFKRTLYILQQEGVEYEKPVVASLISKHFPDFRKVLNELQRYSVSGKIDSGIFVNLSGESYKQLFKIMKEKNFPEVRKWVATNTDNDITRTLRELYDQSNSFLEPASVPQLILILADYQYKAAFVVDQELNLMACFTEIMASCKFS